MFSNFKEKKNDSQLRILYSAKPSLKCKRRIKTFSEIQGLKNSHLFPRVPHQNKKETKHPGSKGWEPSGEGEGRPKTPDPEQNLLLDRERNRGTEEGRGIPGETQGLRHAYAHSEGESEDGLVTGMQKKNNMGAKIIIIIINSRKTNSYSGSEAELQPTVWLNRKQHFQR